MEYLQNNQTDSYLFIVSKGHTFIKHLHEHILTLKGFYNGTGWCVESVYEESVIKICSVAELQYFRLPLLDESFAQLRKRYRNCYHQVKAIQIELEIRKLKEMLNIGNEINLTQLLPFEEVEKLAGFPEWQRLYKLKEEQDSLQHYIQQCVQEEKIAALTLEPSEQFQNLLHITNEQQIAAELQNISPGVFTGYKIGDVDLKLPGGAISIVVGPTSHGKTTLLINFTLGVIEQWIHNKQESSVYFFSYEESRAAIISLFLNTYIDQELSQNNRHSIRSYFRQQDMRYFSSENDARWIFPTKKKEFFDTFIDSGKLHVNYAEFSAQELVAAIRYLKKHSSIGLVCIDYMQLLKYGDKSFSSRQEELKHVCLLLKDCAVETGLPILIAAQFNRTVVTEADLSPTNIGEAGDIERIANLIVGFWNRNFDGFSREGNRNKQGTRILKEKKIYMEILKGRDIGTGANALFSFNGNTGKIENKETNKNLDL